MKNNSSNKLFNVPVLALIALVLIGFLLLLFPWKSADFLASQESSNLKEQFSSRLMAEYHEALRNPGLDNQQALLLANKLTKKGLWKQSGELLDEKLDQSNISAKQRKQFSTIQLRNYLDAYYTASASGEEESNAFTDTRIDVRQHLQDLEDYQTLTNKELVALAKVSTNFGLLPQAVKIYFRLAEIDPRRQAKWLAEAGRWSGHAGDPVSAAKAFKAASQLVSNGNRYNSYTYAWLKAATKAGQTEEVKAFLDESKFQLPRSIKGLELLANSSIASGLPGSASDLFAYLAKKDKPENAQRWFEKAAHWATETKSYAKAVDYLKQAHALTSVDSDHWAIKQRMIEVYVKDEKPEKALALITPMIESNPVGISLLKKGVELSVLNKELATARRWNERFLKLQPKSLDALIGRTDIETLDENFATATKYVKRAIKIAPKDFKLRERWAYLEETQGNDKLAMQLWQWMHEKTNEPNYQRQIIRMAQADLKGDGLGLLLDLSREMKLPKQAVNDVFFYLGKQANPDRGEQFLVEYLAQHGSDKELLENLAKWYGSQKRYPEALATWNKVVERFGADRKNDLLRFELLWAMKNKEEALKLWQANKTDWEAKATPDQLAIMAELTWTAELYQPSLSYYQKLLIVTKREKNKERTLYHTRTAMLLSKLGQQQLALAAFKRGFMETADPDLMINGLQSSSDTKDYQGFNELLNLSREQASLFETEPRYWLMQASIALEQRQYTKATDFYNKLLAIEPNSKEALAGLEAISAVIADAKKQADLKQLATMQEAFDQKDFKRLNALFIASEKNIAAFSNLPQYWLLRSQFSFQQKQFAPALDFYKRLLNLKPESIPARQGIILSLTQLKDFQSLQYVLHKWEKTAETNYELWPNYAVAYQSMKQYQKSIKWFEMASIKHPENYTMLLSYAESLDKLERKEEAKVVRQSGVKQLAQALNSGRLSSAEHKEALFQLLSVMSKVGTQAQFDQTYAQLDQMTQSLDEKGRLNEIALAWALDKDNLPQLKRLLMRDDVKGMKMPLWMTLSIGLKLKDKSRLIAALKQSDKLSTGDHISALLALGRQQQAFEVAKKEMEHGKTTKSRRDARVIALSLAKGRVSEVIAALKVRRIGNLAVREQSLQYKQGMGKNNVPIGYDIKLRKAKLSNNSQPGKAVDERDISVGFDWTSTTDQLNGRVGIFDDGKKSQVYGNLAYSRQLDSSSSAGFEYGFKETPEENAYLRQYGRRNRFKFDYYKQIDKKLAVQLSAWKQEFSATEDGQALGDGTGARAAVVHRENTLNGQWFGGVQATVQKNRNASFVSAEDALPESSQSAELIAGFNSGTPGQGYSGGLQYSGSASLGKVWPTGEIKAHVEAAISKELFENDELSLSVFYDKGSLNEQEDKGLTLKYRKFLDFPVAASKR